MWKPPPGATMTAFPLASPVGMTGVIVGVTTLRTRTPPSGSANVSSSWVQSSDPGATPGQISINAAPSGTTYSVLTRLFAMSAESPRIDGDVEPGWQSVADAFKKNFDEANELG